ncbi:hypothetical protein E3N88_40346 [Mikania micrantha]|uniref:Uncharacterized protein n=1 Tax=Mikania micrantha TaxID=192012 RepID=A0A5N6LMG1_9ASTR|nr:hypothetical protein E3N88_40346 [Mikania micrantha]
MWEKTVRETEFWILRNRKTKNIQKYQSQRSQAVCLAPRAHVRRYVQEGKKYGKPGLARSTRGGGGSGSQASGHRAGKEPVGANPLSD